MLLLYMFRVTIPPQCAATTMYKVDCYAQNIVTTAALVNLQCACLPVACTAHVLLMMGGIVTRNM